MLTNACKVVCESLPQRSNALLLHHVDHKCSQRLFLTACSTPSREKKASTIRTRSDCLLAHMLLVIKRNLARDSPQGPQIMRLYNANMHCIYSGLCNDLHSGLPFS